MAITGLLQESTHYLLDIADNLGCLHEATDSLIEQTVLRRPHQFMIIGPMLQNSSHEEHQRRSLLTRRQIARVNIEHDVLEEVLKLDLLSIGIKTDDLGDYGGLKYYLFDEIDHVVMVALEESPQFAHLHEVNFLLLHLPLESEAVLKRAELLDQL
jgi:hypothetical protein